MEFERVVIYRPAVLLVDREESRWGEAVIRKLLGALDTGRCKFGVGGIEVGTWQIMGRVVVGGAFLALKPEVFPIPEVLKGSEE